MIPSSWLLTQGMIYPGSYSRFMLVDRKLEKVINYRRKLFLPSGQYGQ
jgi:hypothetical protein